MLKEKLGCELAIKFLHYKISTSWRCEEGEEGAAGDGFSPVSLKGLGSKAWADGTKLIKVLLQYSHLSGKSWRDSTVVSWRFRRN